MFGLLAQPSYYSTNRGNFSLSRAFRLQNVVRHRVGRHPQQLGLPPEEARLPQALLHRPPQPDQQEQPEVQRLPEQEGRRHPGHGQGVRSLRQEAQPRQPAGPQHPGTLFSAVVSFTSVT